MGRRVHSVSEGGVAFATTHWSRVVAAADSSAPDGAAALEALCRVYWRPLYGHVRRQGRSREEAQDLTQEFFRRLLERKDLRLADRERGRFRTFLLTSFQRFLVNEWQKENAIKRGGGRANFISFSADADESGAPLDERTAEYAFQKQWALTVLEQALVRLKLECIASGKLALFEQLKDFVWGEKSGVSYAEIGASLQMSEGAVKVAAHRLRSRFRESLRAEVAQTVGSREEVDEELQSLIRILAT